MTPERPSNYPERTLNVAAELAKRVGMDENEQNVLQSLIKIAAGMEVDGETDIDFEDYLNRQVEKKTISGGTAGYLSALFENLFGTDAWTEGKGKLKPDYVLTGTKMLSHETDLRVIRRKLRLVRGQDNTNLID